MKRGLKVTLMTVAAATLGLQAMAMAPVISDIPSPIVGGEVFATGTTPFVFGDALDLNNYVSDDTTANDQLKWSYAISGTPKYAINGVGVLNVATEDPTTPGAKQINNQVLQGETNADGKANTITIRNVNLSPFTGAGPTSYASGIVDSQVVTLFASDGTTYSSKDVMFYSDNGGGSRLSVKAAPTTTNVVSRAFSGGAAPWGWDSPLGNATSSTNGGICISSPMADGGIGSWSSPYGELPLVDNAVYRIRATMNFTQVQAGAKVPFWDVNIQNYKWTASTGAIQGANLYGGDSYFFDNEGGANAISATNTNFEMWWCPLPIQTAQWKAGALAAANSANVQGQLQFRVMDPDSEPGIIPTNKGGQVCMSNLTVDRIDLAQLTAPANLTQVYNKTSFTKNVDANVTFMIDAASQANFTGGTITLTPGHTNPGTKSDGQQLEFGTVAPGDTNIDINNGSTLTDNYPITWEPNTLYMVTMNLSAPDATSESNPWDAFWISMDSPTNEVISESYVTASLNHTGMPKQGTPQTYTTFYYSGKGSNTTIQNGKSLRPKFAIGNNQDLVWNANTGSLRIHSWTVNKINNLPQ